MDDKPTDSSCSLPVPIADGVSHIDSPSLLSPITIPGLGRISASPQIVPDARTPSVYDEAIHPTSTSSDTVDPGTPETTAAGVSDLTIANEHGGEHGLLVQNEIIARDSQIHHAYQDVAELSSNSSVTVVEALQEQDAPVADDLGTNVKPHLQGELTHLTKAEDDQQVMAKQVTESPDTINVVLQQVDTLSSNTKPDHAHMNPGREGDEPLHDRRGQSATLKSEDGLALSAVSHDFEFLEAAAAQREDPDAEWEYDSSDAEALAIQGDASSNSSDSSSTSDESDSSDEDEVRTLTHEEMLEKLNAEDGDDEEGHGGSGKAGAKGIGPTTQHEQPRPAVERITKVLTPEMKISDMGSIEHILKQGTQQEQTIDLVVRTAAEDVDCVLEIGSVVCTEGRKVVGAISEAFGPVRSPFYMVPMQSMAIVQELGLREGMKLFYVNEDAVLVLTEPLKKIKGSDASNLYDEEIGENEMEFSDDEAEAEYKRMLKENRAKRRGVGMAGEPPRRSRPNGYVSAGLGKSEETEYPSGGINYDEPSHNDNGSGTQHDALADSGNRTVNEVDDDVIGYNRLSRPADLHMMAPRGAITSVRRRGQFSNGGHANGIIPRRGSDHGQSQLRQPYMAKGQRGDSRGGSRSRSGRARGDRRGHADVSRHDGRDRGERGERAAGRGDESSVPGDSGHNHVNTLSLTQSHPSNVLTPRNGLDHRGSHGSHAQPPPYGAAQDSMPPAGVSILATGGIGASPRLPYGTFQASGSQGGPLQSGPYQSVQFGDGQSRSEPYTTVHQQTGPINSGSYQNGTFTNGHGISSGPSMYGSGAVGHIPSGPGSAGVMHQYGGAYPYARGYQAGHGFTHSPAPTPITYPNGGNFAGGYYGGMMNTFGGMNNQMYSNQQPPVSSYNPNTNYSGLPPSFGGHLNGYPGGHGPPHAGFSNSNNHASPAPALPPGAFLNPDLARYGSYGSPYQQGPR